VSGVRRKPSSDRLVELAQQIIDPHIEPGPLDREDIREALCELIQRRKPLITMDPYERAVRLAEEWQKSEETRKFLVAIIKLAEELGGFDHETKWAPGAADIPTLKAADVLTEIAGA
jgi:hypothetical protein